MGKHQESEEKFRVDGMEVGKRGKERNRRGRMCLMSSLKKLELLIIILNNH